MQVFRRDFAEIEGFWGGGLDLFDGGNTRQSSSTVVATRGYHSDFIQNSQKYFLNSPFHSSIIPVDNPACGSPNQGEFTLIGGKLKKNVIFLKKCVTFLCFGTLWL